MDTKTPYSDSISPYVLLYQARRDRAIGLPRYGTRTLGLVEYRRQKEREATRSLAGAAFLKAIIDECQSDVRDMIDGADTPEKRREILPQVERLNALAEKAVLELEKMTYAG